MSRMLRLAAAISIPAVIAVLYFIFDPMKMQWMPKCIFFATTGLKCPGCGAQRMLHALMHGDFAAAWSANPFLVILLIPLAFLLWLELFRTRHPQLYARVYTVSFTISALGLLCGWWVIRNIFDL